MVAAAPTYRWLLGQTPGVLRQLEQGVLHRRPPPLAQGRPGAAPADAHAPAPEDLAEDRGERMQTELELRDKEAGEGADALKEQVKAANRSRRSYKDFLRRFCITREEVHLDPDEFDLNFLYLRPFGLRQHAPH